MEAVQVQEEQERRRVGPAKRPVQRERRRVEGRAETVAGHDLEDVAGGDVVLGLGDHVGIVGAADRRGEVHRPPRRARRVVGQRTVQVGHHRLDPRPGGGIGVLGRNTGLRAHRRGQDDLLGDSVEDGDDLRAGHDPVRQAQRVVVDVGQALDQADQIVTQGAEHAGGHGRQTLWQLHARAGDQITQAVQRAARLGRVAASGDVVAFRDLGLVAAAAPHQVRVHGHDRVATAPGPAFDAFKQEAVGTRLGDLQIGRDRGLEIVDQAGPDDLLPSGIIGFRKGVERGLQTHYSAFFPALAASALARASVSTPMAWRARVRLLLVFSWALAALREASPRSRIRPLPAWAPAIAAT